MFPPLRYEVETGKRRIRRGRRRRGRRRRGREFEKRNASFLSLFG